MVLRIIINVVVKVAPDRFVNVDPLQEPLDIFLKFEIKTKQNFNKQVTKLNYFKADYDSIMRTLRRVDWIAEFGGL